MLNIEAMQQLREAYLLHTQVTEAEVLERLGHPSRDQIIETALNGMQSANRNVRVLMLRVLMGQSGAPAMQGILAGLNDPKRRVRSVAIQSSGNYLTFDEITTRLQAMVTDESEIRKIRGQALSKLGGHNMGVPGILTDAMAETLETLAQVDSYRRQILFNLVRLDLTGPVKELLKDFVQNGSKTEAIMATRALYGYRVVNIGQFDGNEAVQRTIMQTCEIASGRVFYWITRDQYDEFIDSPPLP